MGSRQKQNHHVGGPEQDDPILLKFVLSASCYYFVKASSIDNFFSSLFIWFRLDNDTQDHLINYLSGDMNVFNGEHAIQALW